MRCLFAIALLATACPLPPATSTTSDTEPGSTTADTTGANTDGATLTTAPATTSNGDTTSDESSSTSTSTTSDGTSLDPSTGETSTSTGNVDPPCAPWLCSDGCPAAAICGVVAGLDVCINPQTNAGICKGLDVCEFVSCDGIQCAATQTCLLVDGGDTFACFDENVPFCENDCEPVPCGGGAPFCPTGSTCGILNLCVIGPAEFVCAP